LPNCHSPSLAKSRSIIGSMSMPGRPELTTTQAIQPRA